MNRPVCLNACPVASWWAGVSEGFPVRPFPSDIAFTPAVKRIQTARGSRAGYARLEQSRGWRTTVTPDLADFLAGLDMFYLGTASALGQPYIQYRGGSPGFLKVLDEHTLAFADFGGNRQYITVGNLSENSKAFIFLIDYASSQRVKLWGTARVVEDNPELLDRLRDPDYPGKVERAIVFTVEAWDINCPQHIHQRFSQRQIQPVIDQLQRRISELEAQLAQQQADDSRPWPARGEMRGRSPSRFIRLRGSRRGRAAPDGPSLVRTRA
jgi:predicted pyridoxine 5'-phosphate oxidase superfamily flavin-nucleotide-binding protein